MNGWSERITWRREREEERERIELTAAAQSITNHLTVTRSICAIPLVIAILACHTIIIKQQERQDMEEEDRQEKRLEVPWKIGQIGRREAWTWTSELPLCRITLVSRMDEIELLIRSVSDTSKREKKGILVLYP